MSDDNKTTSPAAKGGGSPACPPGDVCPPDCPTKVEFKEHNTIYGFDDHTDPAVPWKSVEKGKTDTIKAEITPAGKFASVVFTSSHPDKVTISPTSPGSASQVVTMTGVDVGESTVTASCGGAELGKFKVKTYIKKSKTVAIRLVHEKNYTSTDLSDAVVKAFLKKVYIQAVFEWTLTRLPAKTVEFDINKDGKIDVNNWMSAEMAKIRDACKDDSYDANLFIVDKPSDGSLGFMDYNQRYGYVHLEAAAVPEMTVAHELGHGGFGLQHKNSDAVNNMSQGDSATKWRLRKDQWDLINP